MNQKVLLRWLLFGSILFLPNSLSNGAEDNQRLRWRGCGIAKTAFMNSCAEAFQAETGVEIQLSGGGATLGIEAAAAGGADLGGTCRNCVTHRNEHLLDVKLAIVAWDALVVVVHRENPVNNISKEQLRLVLQQKITNWSELGGEDKRIVVVGRRGKDSGVGYSTRTLILEDPSADYGSTVIRLNSSGPVEKLVERQQYAIAITGVSSAKKRDLKILSIDSHQATVANIVEAKYPYFRPLYLAYKPGASSLADQFVDWILSEQGQEIIQKQGTVNLIQGKELGAIYKYPENIMQISNYQKVSDLANSQE